MKHNSMNGAAVAMWPRLITAWGNNKQNYYDLFYVDHVVVWLYYMNLTLR